MKQKSVVDCNQNKLFLKINLTYFCEDNYNLMPKKIKLIIAEDHEMIRKCLAFFLKNDSRVHVVGEAENGRELLELLKKTEPDIVLLDLDMPVMNGEEAFKRICLRFPSVKVIIISMHYNNALISEFISKGAAAYLFKNAKPEILLEAIYTVYDKGRYYDHETSDAMLAGLKKEKSIPVAFDKLALTSREIEVLKLLCQDKTSKEIGKDLNIEARTVEFHRRNIYRKTKCKKTGGLVLYAVRSGIISAN